jgi:PPP family 3-phenylpropionic acid transporter
VHLAAMHHIQRSVAPELQASAQGIYAVIGNALLFALLAPVAGRLYGEFEGGAFLAMAVIAGAGTILASMVAPRRR